MPADGKIGREDYFPAAIETFTWHGKLYALPKDATTEILIYNKAMFRERNVPFPTPAWTWDDFLAAAKALTRDTDGESQMDSTVWRLFAMKKLGMFVSMYPGVAQQGRGR